MTTGNYAEVNGINMYYELHGEGAPLVLIHGGGSTIESTFGTMLPMLARHYNVIAVELQAHGRTSDRDAPETFEQDASDVAALLRKLRIPKASILGFSNGGSTTLEMAIRYPDTVHKIIVIAGAYKREGFIPGFFEGMPYATIDHMPQSLHKAFLKVNPDKNALLNMFNKDKQRMIDFLDRNDTDLKNIQSAALLISGDKDVTTPEHALQMSRLITDASVIILPGVHGECIGEGESGPLENKQPSILMELIREFLDK